MQALEKKMAERGYLEGKKMANAFNMLRSNDLIWPYVISNYLKGKQPYPFDLLYWNSDFTRMPAANHSFYLRNCYLENKLSKGQMVIDNAAARSRQGDHPDLQSRDARGSHRAGEVGVPRLEILRRAGEVRARGLGPYRRRGQSRRASRSISTGPATRRSATSTSWLEKATEHPGSWWPDWIEWIRQQAARPCRRASPAAASISRSRMRRGAM